MNKIDLIDQRPQFEPGERPRVWVSAHTGAGIAELKQALISLLPATRGHWANTENASFENNGAFEKNGANAQLIDNSSS